MHHNPPPKEASSLKFAALFKLAMQLGLGRSPHEVNTKWTYDSLSSAVDGGFTPEAVKKWAGGYVIPNEQNVKQIIKILTEGETYAAEWFKCLSHTSSQERQLSRKARLESLKSSKFTPAAYNGSEAETHGADVQTLVTRSNGASEPKNAYTVTSDTELQSNTSTSLRPILLFLGGSFWSSDEFPNRPSCVTTKMSVHEHFLNCAEVLSTDVIDLFDWDNDGDLLAKRIEHELQKRFDGGDRRDL